MNQENIRQFCDRLLEVLKEWLAQHKDTTNEEVAMAMMIAMVSALNKKIKPVKLVSLLLKALTVAEEEA